MSLIKQIYATPSRVRGAYNYLLCHKGLCAPREELELSLSPEVLRSEDGKEGKMVKGVIDECIKLGLFRVEEQNISINWSLLGGLLKSEQAEKELPYYLCQLIFQSEDNSDLCNVLAWYLCQDIYKAPNNWPEVERALRDQVGEGKLGLNNNAAYGQFEDWAYYLGFALLHGIKRLKEQTVLIPDMTKYLRKEIRELLLQQTEQKMLLRELLTKLSDRCPVIEGGQFRVAIENKIGIAREAWQLSTTTSHALMRLLEENSIKLWKESDADVCILDIGSDGRQLYSDVSWSFRKGQVEHDL